MLYNTAMRPGLMVDGTGLTGWWRVFHSKWSNAPISAMLYNPAVRPGLMIDGTGLTGW